MIETQIPPSRSEKNGTDRKKDGQGLQKCKNVILPMSPYLYKRNLKMN